MKSKRRVKRKLKPGVKALLGFIGAPDGRLRSGPARSRWYFQYPPGCPAGPYGQSLRRA